MLSILQSRFSAKSLTMESSDEEPEDNYVYIQNLYYIKVAKWALYYMSYIYSQPTNKQLNTLETKK